jgi:hypothetical protein
LEKRCIIVGVLALVPNLGWWKKTDEKVSGVEQ